MVEENNFIDAEILTGTQNPSLKLIKNTKGYNWEIKILNLDINELDRLNNEMKKRFNKDEM